MTLKRTALLVAVVLVVSATAGCFGPDEDPATTEGGAGEGTETTPGDTVEAGAQPTANPDQTPTMLVTTTGTDGGNETDGAAEAGGENENG